MILMIDNYDSFTFNLVQYLQELGEEVRVVRNDELTVAQIDALKPDRIVILGGSVGLRACPTPPRFLFGFAYL